MSLFRTKTIASLQAEAAAEHGYKRTLGPISLISLGIGSVVGAGIFVLAGTSAAQYAGPGHRPVLRRRRHLLPLRRPVLRRVGVDDSRLGQRLHLQLRDLGGISRLDRRLVPDSGIPFLRRRRGRQLVGRDPRHPQRVQPRPAPRLLQRPARRRSVAAPISC
jgi:hypothetical protein